ncbi:hypothetical protein THAOC_15406 [Thalassiosira oceanica]|uniref:Uncharacterized protein n=1 Tax=Thalassiosira oceanica TaxID=159749 RepID=K0SFW2_THAOC|nr:hypothetical protein THAOC_15406 [Thalassiosira oceanica]|eukprot:EJK63909.1 hypothetical protein THAOC_15406 [Thalassiosira oceanica]
MHRPDPNDCSSALSTAQLIALVQSNRAVVDKVSRLEARVDALQEENDGLKTQVSSLKRRCLETELRCEALEQSVQILKKDVNWVHSAPNIPRIYWEEEGGYQDWEADQINEEVKSMRVHCYQLRNSPAPGMVVEVGPRLFDYPMGHHDILLPHWQELANALNLSQGSINLTISALHLDQSVMDILTPCMKNKLEGLNLDGNDYTSSNMGIEFAISTIQSNPMMTSFTWRHRISGDENPLDVGTAQAQELVSTLMYSQNIADVTLCEFVATTHCSYSFLRGLFRTESHIENLDLSFNDMATQGCTRLPHYLASDPPLRSLNLQGNKLDDADAELIAQAISRNTRLRVLTFYVDGEDPITESGRRVLKGAIWDESTLNAMANRNHSCKLLIGYGDTVLVFSSQLRPKVLRVNELDRVFRNKSIKMHWLLSKRVRTGVNAVHLIAELGGENQLERLPYVLSSIGRYCTESAREEMVALTLDPLRREGGMFLQPMTVLFELIKNWQLPEMFERRQHEDGVNVANIDSRY